VPNSQFFIRQSIRSILSCCLALLCLQSRAAAPSALTSGPVVGKNADGRLEVFRIDEDGQLRHRWQKESNGDWIPWSSLGGNLLPGLAVTTNIDGEMCVFAVERGSNAVMYIRQAAPNGHAWSGWTNLGEALQPPITVGVDQDRRLQVFGVSVRGGTVKHIWQTDAHGGWSSWADMGQKLQPGLEAARNRDGRLELFGVSAENNALMHCWQRQANEPANFCDWTSLGGSIETGFAVGQNVRGMLEVFAVRTGEHTVARTFQSSPSRSEKWSGWHDFGAQVQRGIAAGKTANGRLEIMAVRLEDGDLLHRWETMTDGSDKWSAWKDQQIQAARCPAIAPNEDGDLEVFAPALTNRTVLLHRRQFSEANGWLNWSTLDRATFQYSSRTWQSDEGLPDNVVQALAQTPDGFLWVGTRQGLARFDGNAFKVFEGQDTPLVRYPSVTALWVDLTGTLWVGTDGGGMLRYRDGVFKAFGKGDGLAGDSVRVIHEAKDGTLWIGTTTGMTRWSNGHCVNYTKKQGLLADTVTSILEDSDHNIWIATGGGLNCLTGTKMDSFAMPNGLPNDTVRGICQDSGGRIWIGSNNGMLWHNNIWTRSFYAYNTRFGLSDTFVTTICEDHDGSLWVGTYSGLNRFREGRFFNVLNNEGMPFDKVNALFEDREGNLWVGSKEGLARLTPKPFDTYTTRQGLTHNNIMSVCEDRDNNLWICTWGGGLDKLSDDRVRVTSSTHGVTSALLLSSCEARDGSLWVGADFDGGLTHFESNRVTHYTAKDGLIAAAIRVIYEDQAGRLWVGTSRGLNCVQNGKVTAEGPKHLLSGQVVRAVCEDAGGNLWFGADSGLTFWSHGQSIVYGRRDGLSDESITALFEDKEGQLWIGTGAGGLNRLRNGRFTSYNSRQGLFSDEVLGILDDDQGWLWLSSGKGVFRVQKADLDKIDKGQTETMTCIDYGKSDGLESTHCSGFGKPSAWKSHDGRLWFATSKGLVSVDPAATKIDSSPPNVYIEQILADKKELGTQPAGSNSGAMIQPGRGELEIRYTAVSLQSPEATRFKYKLDRVDQDWVDAGSRRYAYYNHVDPGKYDFRVVACNKDGVWNIRGASVLLNLKPHLWQTWWLQSIVSFSLLGLAGGTGLYITRRRMQRKLELVEQRHAIEKERGRIAKDIHDDLGSSLTRIMMLGERAEEGLDRRENVGVHLNKIVSSARQTVQSLDEIVWAVDPENDSLQGLLDYITHYADEFFEDTNIRCRLDMPIDAPPLSLKAEARHDLFLVAKEAFHNILKHANATEVHVRVRLLNGSLELLISDNGTGFEPQKELAAHKGNGLINMRKRAEAGGGRFSLTSVPGKGTEVILVAPVRPAA